MVQGVREVFEIVDLEHRGDRRSEGSVEKGGKVEGKLVLIGRGMDEGAFGESLRGWLDFV